MEAAFFPEIIHLETGSPVQPGEIGELVLTSLGRVGSPLLRYRTGDIVRRAKTAPCVCGSSELALEGGIHARSDDMVIVRGVNVYPTTVEDVLRIVRSHGVSSRNIHRTQPRRDEHCDRA